MTTCEHQPTEMRVALGRSSRTSLATILSALTWAPLCGARCGQRLYGSSTIRSFLIASWAQGLRPSSATSPTWTSSFDLATTLSFPTCLPQLRPAPAPNWCRRSITKPRQRISCSPNNKAKWSPSFIPTAPPTTAVSAASGCRRRNCFAGGDAHRAATFAPRPMSSSSITSSSKC